MDIEQDLGEPAASAASTDAATPGLGSGAFGVGTPRSAQGTATDIEQDLGESGETAATDPTLR